MAETKTHQKFRNKVEHLEMYLEAMDAAAKMAFNYLGRQESAGKTIDQALPLDCSKYSKLNRPSSNRALVYSFCRSRNARSSIVDLYNYFTEYMRGILGELYDKEPLKIVGKSNKVMNLTYAEIVKIGNFEDIKNKMILEVFRNIENERSTIKLIDKIINGTEVNISEADKNAVLPYLEMRHLYIHNNSKVDGAFESNWGAQFGLRKGDKLPTDFLTANAAITAAIAFVKKLDEEFLRMDLVKPL
jgi:hypothetical protein